MSLKLHAYTTINKRIMGISDDGKISYNLDYRSKKDDAWYTSGVVLEDGKRLRVKLEDFESSYDEVFAISDFSNIHEIEDFLCRFRPVSVPVDLNECSRVLEGTVVCATYTGDGSVRYFDAIVDAVHYKEHSPEKCICTYLLYWQHGPDEGNITAASIDDICHIMSGALDPKVTDFVKLVRDKFRGSSSQSTPKSKTPFLSRKTSSNQTPKDSSGDENSCHGGFTEVKERFKTPLSDHDRDMGGVKDTMSHHYIVLENLEKDLSPVLIKDFIYEQTKITANAFVFQSLLTETYARGVIVLDSRQNLKRVYDFINNPNHFIISLSGRPWVIAEDILRSENFNLMLQPKSEDKNTGNKLMVVRLGTEEYKKAKISKDLYMEFRNHVNRLLKRLDLEEKKNWRTLTAN